MLNIIELAGWGVYPVLFNGLGMLATALVYAIVPKSRFLALLATFFTATLLSGAMGTLRGIQTSAARTSEAGGSVAVFFSELPENLLCLQVAIGLAFLGILMTLVGAARFAAQRSVTES